MILTQKDVSRFWAGVSVLGLEECWPWLRCRESRMGYGRFYLNRKMEYSHRVVWFLTNCPIPELFEGLPACICHICDNPPCCNLAHLFLGNQLINNQDCAIKGCSLGSGDRCKGQNNPKALKTEVEIKEIKQHLQKRVLTRKEIGEMYGISKQVISNISLRVSWSYVKEV